MGRNYYNSGEWNVTCDVCSKKIKSSESRKRWDGFLVCKDDWEERHPQDFVRARMDKISVPITRPIPPLEFVEIVYSCSVLGRTAIAGKAYAGCSFAGNNGGLAFNLLDYNAIAGIAIANVAVSGTGTP